MRCSGESWNFCRIILYIGRIMPLVEWEPKGYCYEGKDSYEPFPEDPRGGAGAAALLFEGRQEGSRIWEVYHVSSLSAYKCGDGESVLPWWHRNLAPRRWSILTVMERSDMMTTLKGYMDGIEVQAGVRETIWILNRSWFYANYIVWKNPWEVLYFSGDDFIMLWGENIFRENEKMKIYYREKIWQDWNSAVCFGIGGRVEIPGMIDDKLVISAAPYAFS